MSSRADDNQLRDNLTISYSAQDNQQKYQSLITNCGNLDSLMIITCVFDAFNLHFYVIELVGVMFISTLTLYLSDYWVYSKCPS